MAFSDDLAIYGFPDDLRLRRTCEGIDALLDVASRYGMFGSPMTTAYRRTHPLDIVMANYDYVMNSKYLAGTMSIPWLDRSTIDLGPENWQRYTLQSLAAQASSLAGSSWIGGTSFSRMGDGYVRYVPDSSRRFSVLPNVNWIHQRYYALGLLTDEYSSHTTLDDLPFRNRFLRRIWTTDLDDPDYQYWEDTDIGNLFQSPTWKNDNGVITACYSAQCITSTNLYRDYTYAILCEALPGYTFANPLFDEGWNYGGLATGNVVFEDLDPNRDPNYVNYDEYTLPDGCGSQITRIIRLANVVDNDILI